MRERPVNVWRKAINQASPVRPLPTKICGASDKVAVVAPDGFSDCNATKLRHPGDALPAASQRFSFMPDDLPPRSTGSIDAARVAQLEARLARIETHLGLAVAPAASVSPPKPPSLLAPLAVGRTEDELEFELGQNWFSIAGILALTIGAAFLLSLPFPSLPVTAPSLAGFAAVALLFAAAHLLRESYASVSRQLYAAGMALLLFATLRLFLPETRATLALTSLIGRGVLLLMVVGNIAFALSRHSAWLTGLACATGWTAAVVVGAATITLPALVLLAGFAIAISHRRNWPGLGLVAVPATYAVYLLWALDLPFHAGRVHFATGPALAPEVLLGCAVILAGGPWLRPKEETENALTAGTALLICGIGYGLFALHTLAAFTPTTTAHHLAAFVVFLGLAIAFWIRRQSHIATFCYAMTGYAALSVAIMKASPSPAVYVWLSVQSVVVVATAIWFRSRFIVVANFMIFVGIVLSYAFVVERETGISLGFGAVALVSARILNWQQRRLELKTGLMRNAYLIGAYLVFPYALYHLVPGKYVGLAWIGLALGYYALNFLVKNQKYRWMGHATLLLTMCYLVVIGTSRFEPLYRVLSFLGLGTVLLSVSLVFTRLRKTQRATAAATATAAKVTTPPP